MKYRHEWKFEINQSDLITLRLRLQASLMADPHTVEGKYTIRSLYFDNLRDKALREKIDGVNKREKFRLRLYDGDTSLIKLEKKSKVNGLCLKEGCTVSQDTVSRLLVGQATAAGPAEPAPQLLQELYFKMTTQGLRPKTIVEYEREPFIFPAGNVRVTLDTRIRTGMKPADFLSPRPLTIPTDHKTAILEVKWDEFLPDIIKDLVALDSRRAAAFSKYANCRIYG